MFPIPAPVSPDSSNMKMTKTSSLKYLNEELKCIYNMKILQKIVLQLSETNCSSIRTGLQKKDQIFLMNIHHTF